MRGGTRAAMLRRHGSSGLPSSQLGDVWYRIGRLLGEAVGRSGVR